MFTKPDKPAARVRSSGKSIAQVAVELGVNRETLRFWARRAGKREALESVGIGQVTVEVAAPWTARARSIANGSHA